MPDFDDDDDDWVGTPPEGHYSRDRAKPEFWNRPWPWAWSGMVSTTSRNRRAAANAAACAAG